MTAPNVRGGVDAARGLVWAEDEQRVGDEGGPTAPVDVLHQRLIKHIKHDKGSKESARCFCVCNARTLTRTCDSATPSTRLCTYEVVRPRPKCAYGRGSAPYAAWAPMDAGSDRRLPSAAVMTTLTVPPTTDTPYGCAIERHSPLQSDWLWRERPLAQDGSIRTGGSTAVSHERQKPLRTVGRTQAGAFHQGGWHRQVARLAQALP